MENMRPSSPPSSSSALHRKQPLPTPPPGPPLPPDIPVDEEISPVYHSECFYPAKPGELLANRYQLLVKVGWGVSSTVWFARDLQRHIEEPEKAVTLKIANTDASSAESSAESPADHEREIEEHISAANPSHRGRSLMRLLEDSFEINRPEGAHLCLVYPPMREPLSMYQRRFEGGKVPLPLIKIYIGVLLTGLDYLHTECRTVHTDLKLENIMVSFEDPTVFAEFINAQLEEPMAFKVDSTGRPVYQSRNDFGPPKGLRSIPQLVDFGSAMRLKEDDDSGILPIQPGHYRAPEVILGNGWQMAADIWNFGVLMWDMIEGKELFQHIHDKQGRYDAKLHIAEMIALLGPPHPAIIQRYQRMREYKWPVAIRRDDGVLCETAEEYFHGPFFDENSCFLYEDLIPDRKLSDTVTCLEGEEKEAFLDLAKKMLVWHPTWRISAADLAKHPFLQL